jgi:competence protein ComEC
MPFGYDAFGWQVMGFGIELMLAIARWVAALPGAEGRVAAFGSGALLCATAGLLFLALPASRLRLAGAPLLGVALLLAVTTSRPEVLIEAEGRVVAVRGANGRLSILDARRSRIAAENWLAADGDGRKLTPELAAGFDCDRERCRARMHDGSTVVVMRERGLPLEECVEATLVVTRFDGATDCAAPIVDLRMLATTGALSLRRLDGRWIAEPARSPIADRPWFGRRTRPDAGALNKLDGARRAAPGNETTNADPEERSWGAEDAYEGD